MARKAQAMAKTKKINLALQGGGAHGAFTWGVLDRLLEEEDIEVAAISGTSAGALNAAAFKSGLIADGRQGAKDNLDWLWSQVSGVSDLRMATWMVGFNPGMVSRAIEYSLPFSMVDGATRMFSPYVYGPFYTNPLRRIVERFAFDRVCADVGPVLHICATNVRTGKVRVFEGRDVSTDVILASACLPTLFQAVEFQDPEKLREAKERGEPPESVEEDAFWDGGYTGNPALFPLYSEGYPDDVVIVNINPLVRDEVPMTAQDIQNRINEVSFNSSLLRELRAIDFVRRLLADGSLKPGTMKHVNVHMISDDALMNELSVATKMIPSPYVIGKLKEAGRAACEGFLTDHKSMIGKDGTVNLRAMFD